MNGIEQEWMMGLAGGLLIGVVVSLNLLTNGWLTGISGYLQAVFRPMEDRRGKIIFTAGLIAGGLLLLLFYAEALPAPAGDTGVLRLAVAGLLVGFGTAMGRGCTSGHGICGVGRLSRRSLTATVLFILSGMVMTWMTGGLS